MSIRVRVSRAISRRFLRSERMLCAVAEERRWPVRHLFNLAFRWREADHCDSSARWEARQEQGEPDTLEMWRRAGLL